MAEEGLGRAGRETGSDWYVERKASEEGNWYEVGKALEGVDEGFGIQGVGEERRQWSESETRREGGDC